MVVFAYIYSLQVKTKGDAVRYSRQPTASLRRRWKDLFNGDADSILDTRRWMDATPAFNLLTWKWEKRK